MRTILTALALMIPVLGGQPSRADVIYLWCAQYGDTDGRNCGFSTVEQCRAAVSGNGGYCIENGMYRPGSGNVPAPPRSRR